MTSQPLTKRQSIQETSERKQKEITTTLLDIAKKHSIEVKHRGDLETRYSDQEDFIELSVKGLKSMLQEAFEAGKNS